MKQTRMYRSLISVLAVFALVVTGCAPAGEPGENPDTTRIEEDVATPVPREETPPESDAPSPNTETATLLYQGHGSFRITTREGKVVYVDPYAGEGYDAPADMILVSHQHPDHNQVDLVETRNADCIILNQDDFINADGSHQTYEYDYIKVEPVRAENENHDPLECVGLILTFSDGTQVYASCDTSKTEQMASFAERNIDYALFCCDGNFNMDIDEASECASLVGARYSIPYHMSPGELFDRERAEQFQAEGRLIVADGEEITLA